MSPALLLAAALAFSPLQKEQEDVRAGNEKVLSGDPQGALGHYQAAEAAVGAHPEIEFDRGHAAYRLGKLDDAAAHFKRAAEQAPPPLASRALQNLGNTLDAKGDRTGAIGAYVDALRRDPANEDARYDLEVLLRRKDPPKQPQQQGGKPSQGGKGEQPQQAPQPSPGPRQDQARPEPQGKDGKEAPQKPEGNGQKPEEAQGESQPRPGPLTKQDAEKLLDALRAREKNMPFAGRDRKGSGRVDAERDW